MTPGRPVRAFVSLGSNLGDREGHLGDARAALIDEPDLRIVSCSATIETDPVDVTDQPKFLNQVLGIETALSPRALLEICLAVERELGRDRTAGPPRGPRTIDLDILLYDGRRIDEDGLTIPHPRLGERSFFLELCRQAGAPAEWLP
ncbi:MAG: 2-amino-4-hydroxy-6-hydroxymethyldihydropteridine diphosphokinase [Gemmatimonadota bacterium]